MSTATESVYDKQASDFLAKYGLGVSIVKANTKSARWTPHGHHYVVTLVRNGGKKRVSFDYFGSVADKENGKPATAYGVLACVSYEITCPDTFGAFCDDFGCEPNKESRETFKACDALAKKLRAFFKKDERADLAEIQ